MLSQLTYQPAHPFDIDGDELCLDFANTASFHLAPQPNEHLKTYLDLAAWGFQASLYSEAEYHALLERAKREPQQADRAFSRALELREAIFRIFTALAQTAPLEKTDIDTLNRHLQSGLAHASIQPGNSASFNWEWDSKDDALERMLWPVARSAAELLTNPERLARVGQCQDDRGCGWLFIDTSKNHSRRWCSMESCGNRAKAMRHYGRTKIKRSKTHH